MIVVNDEEIARAAHRVGVAATWLKTALTAPDCPACSGTGHEPRQGQEQPSPVATPWHHPYRPCGACAGLGVQV